MDPCANGYSVSHATSSEEGKTKVKNGSPDDENGLSTYFQRLAKKLGVQVVVFNSSLMDRTEKDMVQTIKN